MRILHFFAGLFGKKTTNNSTELHQYNQKLANSSPAKTSEDAEMQNASLALTGANLR